jgi:hypothetical protein
MPAFAPEAFDGLIGRLLWLALVHSLWIGLLTASAVALIFQFASRLSHRARHAILAVAMLVVAWGPGAVAIVQHLAFSRAAEVGSPGDETTLEVIAGGPADGGSNPGVSPTKQQPVVGLIPARGSQLLSGAFSRAVAVLVRLRPMMVVLWLVPAACLSATLLLGAFGLRRLRRTAEPASIFVQDRCRCLARLLRLRRIPEILIHTRLAEPFLCGIRRPTILLPERWAGTASVTSLDGILAHELAHACRRDQVVNLAQRLVEVALFFHPAVHWLSQSLRRERELCADALAVRLTGDPLALAEALQSVARLRLRSPRIPVLGASLGGPSLSLLPRIQELIGMTPSRPRFALWPFAALPAAGLLALTAVSAGLAGDWPVPGARVEAKRPPAGIQDERSLQDDRMISYFVRYVYGPPEPWRQLLLPRMKLLKQEADFSAWLLDGKGLFDLLTQAQGDTRTNVLSAPKLCGYNGAEAKIMNRKKLWYVAGFDQLDAPGPGFRPRVKGVDEGITLSLTGSILPRATRLSVNLEETSLLGFHTMHQKKRVGEEIHAAEYQIPTTANRNSRVDCELPDGAYLLISLGVHEQPGSLPGLAELANDVFASVGLPQYQPAPVARERLVIIGARPVEADRKKPPGRSAAGSSVHGQPAGR